MQQLGIEAQNAERERKKTTILDATTTIHRTDLSSAPKREQQLINDELLVDPPTTHTVCSARSRKQGSVAHTEEEEQYATTECMRGAVYSISSAGALIMRNPEIWDDP